MTSCLRAFSQLRPLLVLLLPDVADRDEPHAGHVEGVFEQLAALVADADQGDGDLVLGGHGGILSRQAAAQQGTGTGQGSGAEEIATVQLHLAFSWIAGDSSMVQLVQYCPERQHVNAGQGACQFCRCPSD